MVSWFAQSKAGGVVRFRTPALFDASYPPGCAQAVGVVVASVAPRLIRRI
jgi:hypothetical protein